MTEINWGETIPAVLAAIGVPAILAAVVQGHRRPVDRLRDSVSRDWGLLKEIGATSYPDAGAAQLRASIDERLAVLGRADSWRRSRVPSLVGGGLIGISLAFLVTFAVVDGEIAPRGAFAFLMGVVVPLAVGVLVLMDEAFVDPRDRQLKLPTATPKWLTPTKVSIGLYTCGLVALLLVTVSVISPGSWVYASPK